MATPPEKTTLRGFGDLGPTERIEDDLPRVPTPPIAQPFFTVEQVDEQGAASISSASFTAYAIHTQRRVYCLDAKLVCLAVLDCVSMVPVLRHPVVGAELVGAQHKDATGKVVRVVQPLPDEGSHAVFSRALGGRKQVSETSPVTRVVLRMKRVTLV